MGNSCYLVRILKDRQTDGWTDKQAIVQIDLWTVNATGFPQMHILWLMHFGLNMKFCNICSRHLAAVPNFIRTTNFTVSIDSIVVWKELFVKWFWDFMETEVLLGWTPNLSYVPLFEYRNIILYISLRYFAVKWKYFTGRCKYQQNN